MMPRTSLSRSSSMLALAKGLAQHRNTLRHTTVSAFLAFKFEGDVTSVIHFGQDLCDPFIIQVERVPFAAPVISLGLDKHSLGGDQFQSFVWIFEEVSGVHQR